MKCVYIQAILIRCDVQCNHSNSMPYTDFWLSGAFVTVKSKFYHKADFGRDAILALLFGHDFYAIIYFRQ